MKILHATHNYFPSIGGAQLVVHHLAQTQMKHGHDVHVMIPRKRRARLPKNIPYNILEFLPGFSHFSKHPKTLHSKFFFNLFAKWVQKNHKFDVWHLHALYPEGLLIPALKHVGVPVVATLHTPYFGIKENRKQYELDLWLVHNILKHANFCCVLCENDAQKLTSMGMPEKLIQIMDNGVDTEAFDITPDIDAIKTRYGIPKGVPLLISSGRNSHQKGFDLIPSILKCIRDNYGLVHWCIIGRDTQLLREVAEAEGVGEMVTALGQISPIQQNGTIQHPPSEYAELLRSADVFVSLSRAECCSLVLFEALAAKLPLIYTNIARSNELDTWNIGKKIRVDDVPTTAKTIINILKNKAEANIFSENGATLMKNNFSWDVVAKSHENIYNKILT